MWRPNASDSKVSELDKIDIKTLNLTKVWDRFGLSCSYCKQGALHPLPQESGWSSEDWDGTKAKAREQTNTLKDYNTSRPHTDNDQTTDANKVAFSKLQIRQSDLREELREVTDSLIPPSLTETPEDVTGKNDGKELSDIERKLQEEEESYDQYHRIYMGQLSEEEESDTQSHCSTYRYFT